MMTRNIADYAKACNVDARDMVKALQADPLAREQFEAWRSEKAQTIPPVNDGGTTGENARRGMR